MRFEMADWVVFSGAFERPEPRNPIQCFDLLQTEHAFPVSI